MIARKRRPSATGASRARGAAGGKPSGRSPDEKQARLKEMKKGLRDVGLRPREAASIFCVSGCNTYAISPQQLVSVAAHEQTADPVLSDDRRVELAQLEARREANNRPMLLLNAGQPTASKPRLGECFKVNAAGHSHAFRAEWDELHEKTLSSSNGVAPFDAAYSDEPFCSNADVIARYAGHRALTAPGGATLFVTLFLNEGEREIADRPGQGAPPENVKRFVDQKCRFRREIGKLWLLYPDRVEPACDARGNAYALGEFEAANAAARAPAPLQVPYVNARAGIDCRDVRDTEYETLGAPVLVAFATLQSDKAPGAPGNVISGYHDRSRAWVLSPAHVAKLRKIVEHFELEGAFPGLARISGSRLTGTLDMAHHRKAAQEGLGEPPAALTDALEFDGEWREQRLALLFQKPWVQQCNPEHPGGVKDEAGQPVLVPLIKDGCEERNGSPWLDAEELLPRTRDAFEAGATETCAALARYDALQTALCSLVGRRYTPKHHARGLSEGDAAQIRQELKRLRASCADQAARLDGQAAELARSRVERNHWRRMYKETKEELDARTDEPEEDGDAHYTEVSSDDSAPGWGEVTDEDAV